MNITPLHQWIANRIQVSGGKYTRHSLQNWQLERLQKMIAYTSINSPFYRGLFAGLPNIRSLDDLDSYPFTNADDLSDNPAAFVCVSQEEVHRIVTLPTSGTTRNPKRLYFSQEDQELTVDFFRVGMSTLARTADRVLILLPGERPGSVGDLLHTGLTRLGCSPYKYGPVDDEDRVLQLIREEGINVMVGAPVHLYRLACCDELHRILPKGQVRTLLVSTDVLPRVIATRLTDIWGCEVFDHYGMTETGLGGGVECSAHNGYHMREADLYLEVIDPETGEVLCDGEEGEVVISTLTRNAMPLIRYRTGDISCVIPGICGCGSFIKRLAPIKRRWGSGIQIGNAVLYQDELDEALFQVRGVCDFKTFLRSNKHDTPILTIALRMMGECLRDVQSNVQGAVSCIPGIDLLMQNGELLVQITQMDTATASQATAFAKRKIVDQRTDGRDGAQASR